MSGKKSRAKEARVEVKLRLPRSRLALVDANCKLLCISRDGYFDNLLDLAPFALDPHRQEEKRPKEDIKEFELQLPKSRLALADDHCEALGLTRNGYFGRLVDLAPIVLDRHSLAEGIASLQFQLWQIQHLADECRIDRDLAQAIVKAVEGTARKITHKLRMGQ
jgi:hypothetical protein